MKIEKIEGVVRTGQWVTLRVPQDGLVMNMRVYVTASCPSTFSGVYFMPLGRGHTIRHEVDVSRYTFPTGSAMITRFEERRAPRVQAR